MDRYSLRWYFNISEICLDEGYLKIVHPFKTSGALSTHWQTFRVSCKSWFMCVRLMGHWSSEVTYQCHSCSSDLHFWPIHSPWITLESQWCLLHAWGRSPNERLMMLMILNKDLSNLKLFILLIYDTASLTEGRIFEQPSICAELL